MKTIYHVYSDRYGEVEGMFLPDGTMLGCWCDNDANWRHEYFNGFMLMLDIVISAWDEDSAEYKAAVLQIRDAFGLHYLDEDESED